MRFIAMHRKIAAYRVFYGLSLHFPQFPYTFVYMNTAANIEQVTENAGLFQPIVPPREYSVSAFIDRSEWSRRTVYCAMRGTGGSNVSPETREKIRAELIEDIRRWEQAPAA